MPRRLAVRLILSLTVAFAVVEGISQYLSVGRQEKELLDNVIIGADQLSRSITGATWQAMLADHRETAYQVMKTIAEKQGIDHIHIFNREGRLMFSTSPLRGVRKEKWDDACNPCHLRDRPLSHLPAPSRARVVRGPDGQRKLAMITAIYNEPACSTAKCHAHPAEVSVLGILDVGLDLTPVDRELRGLRTRTIVVAVVEISLIGLIVAAFTSHFVAAPIRRLIEGTKAISALQLDRPIAVETSTEELDQLASSFDEMRKRLREAQAKNEQFTRGLEAMVDERTAQLTAAHRRLLQTDRLVSLGQLAASVAHEINNPISGVLNLSMLMQRVVDREGELPPERLAEFRGYLAQVTNETARIGRIVGDLLSFSRRSRRQSVIVELNAIVNTTVTLIHHKLQLAGVELALDLASDLPPLRCDASQIQEVVMNLVLNAAEATPPGGLITVATRLAGTAMRVELEVRDTGAGIPESIIGKIFDPFFTTKEEGKGVGLGLAVVYGIVEGHGGEIEVTSKVGKGSSFRVSLPLGEVTDSQPGGEARQPPE
ncbi:MAG: sensor histidine kinase [Acidobacteriota bacterium]